MSSLPPLVLACMVPQEKVPAGRSSRLSLQHWSRALRSRPGPPPLSWRRQPAQSTLGPAANTLPLTSPPIAPFFSLLSRRQQPARRPRAPALRRPAVIYCCAPAASTVAAVATLAVSAPDPAGTARSRPPEGSAGALLRQVPLIYAYFLSLRSEGLSNKRVERP